jgi:hypothetical protein
MHLVPRNGIGSGTTKLLIIKGKSFLRSCLPDGDQERRKSLILKAFRRSWRSYTTYMGGVRNDTQYVMRWR